MLLGADDRHLAVRASVLCAPDRVVLGSAVAARGARGRTYLALVRRIHPLVARALLTRPPPC